MARILVVEDDPLMGQDISLKLQQFGYEVVAVVADSEGALGQAEETSPDLILMDILLEGEVDGIETARRILQRRRVPVIYLTAYADDEFIRRARITEPYGYVLKPCSGRELQAVVSIALYRASLEGERRQAAELASSLSAMRDPLIRLDREDRVMMANQAAERMLGVSLERMRGEPISTLLCLQRDGRGENLIGELVAAAAREMQPVERDHDLLLRRERPPRLPVSIRISAIPQQAGSEGGVIILLQDISSRQAMQQELDLVAQVFKASSEGILITDSRPRILRVNDAYLRITGYRREEVLGRNPNILASGYHDSTFYTDLWRELLETGSWSGEIWNRRKDGEVFPEILNITALRDRRGNTTHYIGIFTDVSDSRNLQERLHYLTRYDTLTGLANRNLFEQRLTRGLADAARDNHALALLMLDIDNFNTVNEVWGHAFGDRLLREFAQRLSDFLQQEEVVARFGGDIFALIVEERPEVGLETLTQTLLDVVCTPYGTDGKPVRLTASVGISLYPGDGEDAHELLKCADNALHHAKRAGKNCYRFFDREMYQRSIEVRRIEQGLRSAIEREELRLHYQPQVDINSGRVSGCEALVRWQPPGQEMLIPAAFIPIAEETGQIVAIGRWVLCQACRQFGCWLQQGCQPNHVAVNVSARQFRDPEFVATVANILQETGMQPCNLMLEVTESVAMNQTDGTLERLQELKAMGVRLSLDDFGTGYSALSSLQRYPFDTLKIDRSFIVESLASEHGAALLEAIIKMSHALNLETIAEGVEEWSQVSYLHSLGCHQAQGYYYSRPLEAAQLGERVLGGFPESGFPA